MTCTGYDFNLPKNSAKSLLIKSNSSVKRYMEEVPMTSDEKTIIERYIQKLNVAIKKDP